MVVGGDDLLHQALHVACVCCVIVTITDVPLAPIAVAAAPFAKGLVRVAQAIRGNRGLLENKR